MAITELARKGEVPINQIFHSWFYSTIAYLAGMINVRIGGIIAAAFIAGAFVASPKLRAFAANTAGSSDMKLTFNGYYGGDIGADL